jgi:indole-3-glycerol phosphate synthase
MDILTRIVETKKAEVAADRQRRPLAELEARCRDLPPPRPFEGQLAAPGPSGANIIAEIKRRSPSKGPLAPDLDPAATAAAYGEGGAAALSVLTDTEYFAGSPEDLAAARSAVRLPVLRKDFLIDPYQVYASRLMGADAVLLICRILSRSRLGSLLALTRELGMDALVEVHDEDDLASAAAVGARLVGINNRNLATFDTDLGTAERLSAMLGEGQIPVAASGIRNRTDVERSLERGIFNFLVGESLVRAPDPRSLLAELQGMDGPGAGRGGGSP